MHDTPSVRGIKSIGNLNAVPNRVIEGQRTSPDPLGHGLPLEQFHHQVIDAFMAANVVQSADVCVVQARDGLGFAVEPLPATRIVRQALKQDLDCDHAIQAQVAGAVHLTHPAGAEQTDNLIPADTDAMVAAAFETILAHRERDACPSRLSP